jgi:hypothetical protein
MGKICSAHGGKRNAYRVLVGKPEKKRQPRTLGRKGMIVLKWILDK